MENNLKKDLKNYLKTGLEKKSINVSDDKIIKLLRYLELLVEYNSHTNLTAIRDEKEIIEKHIIDSLLLHNLLESSDGSAIDIGTGAGFPGMILAICNPQINFTLMDSIAKKTKFLELVKDDLNLSNVNVITKRAEEFISDETRESYDVGLCRGVSKLPIILEYMIPFLKVKGRFLVQKSVDTGEELVAETALEILNSKIEKEFNFELPYNFDKRKIIVIRKEKITDKKYPRRVGIPEKRPL